LQSDHQPFLRQLDQNVTQLPPSLGYASGVIPEPYALKELRGIVAAVEGWTLPQAGQPYTVYGTKGNAETAAGGGR
jgi:phosphonate transport system substrate-binding protein